MDSAQRSERGRCRLAAITAIATTAMVIAVVGATADEAPGGPAGRATVADAELILKKLARMNQDLDRVIRHVEKGAKDLNVKRETGDVISQSGRVGTLTFGTGLHADVAYHLKAVDVQLASAHGWEIGAPNGEDTENREVEALDAALNAVEQLEKKLLPAPGVTEEAFKTLRAILKRLKKLKRAARNDDLDHRDLERAAEDIAQGKYGLVGRFFDQPVFYSLRFGEVFRLLDCVDSSVTEAQDLDAASEGTEPDKVKQLLKAARKCKERLEAAIKETLAAPLSISPITAAFVEAQRLTNYTVTVDQQPQTTLTYQWSLTLQAVDPSKGVDSGCTNRGVFGATTEGFAWHHGNIGDPVSDDGCDHSLEGQYGHQGLIGLIVSDNRGWSCTATYKGTKTSDANSVSNGTASAPDCKRG